MKTVPSCHRLKPQDQWCDAKGPGDFMGHTCVQMPMSAIQIVEDVYGPKGVEPEIGAKAPDQRRVRRLLLDLAQLIDYNRGMGGIGL